MANYNFQGTGSGLFVKSTQIPVIGAVVDTFFPTNSLRSAVVNSNTQLIPGDPVVVLIPNNNTAKAQNADYGLNPFGLSILAKATTITGGVGTTDVCGFIVKDSNNVNLNPSTASIPMQGQVTNVALLGSGAQIWLEVVETNTSAFQATLDTNTLITLDTTNGGVKIGTSSDNLAGVKLVSGLTDCKKIALNATTGGYEYESAFGVLVQLL